jgi:hypothetical protein
MAIDSSLKRSSSLLDSVTLPSGSISASVRPALLGQYSFGVGVVRISSVKYRTLNSRSGSDSGLIATAYLQDGSPGDTLTRATYPSSFQDVQDTSASPATITLLGEITLSDTWLLGDWQATYNANYNSSLNGATGTKRLDYKDSTGSWQTGTPVAITLRNGISVYDTATGNGSAITGGVQAIRFALNLTRPNNGQPTQVSLDLYDFRVSLSPSAPVLTANFCSAAGTSVSLSWATVSVAVNYRVYRDGALVATVTAPTISYVATSQSIAESHTWTVRTWDGISESSNSNAVTGATSSTPTVTLAGTLTKCGKFIDLTWTVFPASDASLTATITHSYLNIFGQTVSETIYSGNASGSYTYTLRSYEIGSAQTFVLSASNPCGSGSSTLVVSSMYSTTPDCTTTYVSQPDCSTTYTDAPTITTTYTTGDF